LQPYPVVAADSLLEIGSALISAVLSLDEHLSQTNTSCVPKFFYESVGRIYHVGGSVSDFIFKMYYVIVAGLHFKWYSLNKQSQTFDKAWSSSLGVGQLLVTLHSKNAASYQMLRRA
jgi:hypothetical protein